MLKVTIRGEVYPFDQRYPLHEAIEIEDQAGISFGRYQEMLITGSARGVAIFAWCVLRRNGVDVSLADILSGKYELDTDDINAEPEGAAEAGKDPGPDSSAATTGDGSPSSRSGSDSPPRKPARSRSTSSIT